MVPISPISVSPVMSSGRRIAGVEAQSHHDHGLRECDAGGEADEQHTPDVRGGGRAPGSTALVTGTIGRRRCRHSLLSMRDATSAVAPTTALAMSFAFCGDVDVANTWMRGLDGSTE